MTSARPSDTLVHVCDCDTKSALVCKEHPDCRPSYCKMRRFDPPVMALEPLTSKELDYAGRLRGWIGHPACPAQAVQDDLKAGADEIDYLRALLAQWEKNCTGMHGSQSPCGLTADHKTPSDRTPSETVSVAPFPYPTDRDGWICSVCHGWNGPKTRVCLHSHLPLEPTALKALPPQCSCDPNPSIGGSPPCPMHDGESEGEQRG